MRREASEPRWLTCGQSMGVWVPKMTLHLEAATSLVLRAARRGDAPATPALPDSRQDSTMAASPNCFGEGNDAAVAKDPCGGPLPPYLIRPSTFPLAAMDVFDPRA